MKSTRQFAGKTNWNNRRDKGKLKETDKSKINFWKKFE